MNELQTVEETEVTKKENDFNDLKEYARDALVAGASTFAFAWVGHELVKGYKVIKSLFVK